MVCCANGQVWATGVSENCYRPAETSRASNEGNDFLRKVAHMKLKLSFPKRASPTPNRSTATEKRYDWRPSCQELAEGLQVTEVPDLEPEELERIFAMSPSFRAAAKPATDKEE